jgi:2-keto-3-deoxy-L-rhamnonate aldolase RhmA
MQSNRVKALLKKGQPTFGVWIWIGSPDAVEMLAHLGFDWLVFDMEHAPVDIGAVQSLMQASNGTEITPFVRVAWNDIVMIKRALDIGAQGLVIPWVNSKDDAVKAVQAARYPPRGLRGVSPRRAALYGLDRNYLAEADNNIAVIVQIETPEAVENAKDILSVDGVDAYFIGPMDLSTSMGIQGQFDHPEFRKAITRVADAGKALGIPGGIMCRSVADIKRAVEDGFKFIALGTDFDYLRWGAQIALAAVGRAERAGT